MSNEMADTTVEERTDSVSGERDEEEASGKIQIDSSLIKSATIHGEDAELGSLGLRLYDQSTLESGIRLQVDEAMEKMEAKRQKLQTEKRIRTLRNRIGQLSQKCQRLKSSTVSAPRTYEELQRQKRQQTELHELRDELAQLRAELNSLEAGSSQDASESAAALLAGAGESELEVKVRLGEVTPFGTDLSAVTTDTASCSSRLFDSPIPMSSLAGPAASQPIAAPSAAETTADQSDRAAHRPSAGVSQSEDEYVPSDEPADESDDAYVPSDEEVDEDGGRSALALTTPRRGKRKHSSAAPRTAGKSAAKRGRRAPDDGDPEAYAARIRAWRQERREQRLLRIEQGFVDDDEDERCVEFDGGFRCPAQLWDRLFKYQQVCVRWLWELHQQRCGGILGDEMGLGKTIQVIAFLAGLSRSNVRWGGERGLGPVLVMAPATVIHQWVAEFHKWWPPLRVAVLHESGSHAGSKSSLVRQIGRSRGVLVTSYSAMTSHKDLLIAQDWHYVILDEGHKIRNPDAQITLAVKQVRTPHRVILSGSPLQNNLRELWSLFDFVFPGKLGTLPVFMSQFAVPITQGGYTNASDSQVVTAFRCAKVLRDTIAPYLLRRMKADVQQTLQLPTKNEQVLFCRLTDIQRQLYQDYINSDGLRRILQGRMKVFVGLIALRKLCNHPDLLTGTPADTEDLGEDQDQDQGPADRPDQLGHWRRSGKMVVLSALLDIWRRQQHKVLLFTQSRQMLSILESFVAGRGYSYLKMDGTTSVGSRQTLIQRFNTDPELFCFLLTTRVGGLGVNLTGANRIIIYDPDWNPSTDQQARERAWRIGQDRHVTIYRLLTAGTIEEKIYHRQIFKQFLTNRVLKDPKQQRFFKTNDLHDLFTLTEEPAEAGGGGDDGSRRPAAAPQTTETAEIFRGSQVSAAALEARRQRERQQRRQRQEQLARQAEGRKQKLLEKARLLNRKLFRARATQQSGQAAGDNGEKKKKRSHKKDKTRKSDKKSPEGEETTEDATTEKTDDKGTDICNGTTDDAEIEDGEITDTPAGERAEDGERAENAERATPGSPSRDRDGGKKTVSAEEVENGDSRWERPSVPDDPAAGPSVPDAPAAGPSAPRGSPSDRRRRRKKSRRRRRDPLLGEVEGLVDSEVYRPPQADDQTETDRSQDDYVLTRLFKKSGVHSAVRHDVIEGHGTPDGAILEAEATQVAREAVAALRASRREVRAAEIGVPTWTGQSGRAGVPTARPRFGQKKNPLLATKPPPPPPPPQKKTAPTLPTLFAPDPAPVSRPAPAPSPAANLFGGAAALGVATPGAAAAADAPLSSAQLLARIRSRAVGEDGAERADVAQEHADLLADIRNFVAFQTTSNGRASTKEILAEFKGRLPAEQTPLFRALLNEICEFERGMDRTGWWVLREELR